MLQRPEITGYVFRGHRDSSALEREDRARESRIQKQQNQVLKAFRLQFAQVRGDPDSTGDHAFLRGRSA